MKADTTRSTYAPEKHYHDVRLQQGRVQLDADWNEQVDIAAHRVETEALDVIGPSGAPMHAAGFQITVAGGALQIGAGRYYVDGVLCENEAAVLYTAQPDLPGAALPTDSGTYAAYLDVWPRSVTWVEDDAIREVALGGPDTATRTQTVWQVKLSRLSDQPSLATTDGCAVPNDLVAMTGGAPTGQLTARAEPDATSTDLCLVAPGAGYRRLENQHYRVEVHAGGNRVDARFKWSRDNGSIVTPWTDQAGADLDALTVGNAGRDRATSFASGTWIELTDDERELSGVGGTLVRVKSVAGDVLTIDPATVVDPIAPDTTPNAARRLALLTRANFRRNPKIRRWDMAGLLAPKNANFLDLEDGVQVSLSAGTYRAGDYWLIPARTATADVEWPGEDVQAPIARPPAGVTHHYARLAVLGFDAPTKTWSVNDCRSIFPPLTEQTEFFIVGGDGQEAMPVLATPTVNTPLPNPLEVGVSNGRWPVAGATVRFTTAPDSGVVSNGTLTGTSVSAKTDARGIARCDWSIAATNVTQQVIAELIDPFDPLRGVVNPPLHFGARPSLASQVAYDTGRSCTSLGGTVQSAIDRLATLASLYLASGNGQVIDTGKHPDPLVVLVADRCGPIAGATVLFAPGTNSGQVQTKTDPLSAVSASAVTGENGLAECSWQLGPAAGDQIVTATLVDVPRRDMAAPTAVEFTAQRLVSAGGKDPGFFVTGTTLGMGKKFLHNIVLDPSDLARGIVVACSEQPWIESFGSRQPGQNPVCYVTVDVPYPLLPQEMESFKGLFGVAFHRAVLATESVSVAESSFTWIPVKESLDWVRLVLDMVQHRVPKSMLLARLVVKGSAILDDDTRSRYLDGPLYVTANQSDVLTPSGDGVRGGDLEWWFWLR